MRASSRNSSKRKSITFQWQFWTTAFLALFLRKKAPPKKVRKKFFFEAMWTRDERCKEVIEGAWDPLQADVDIQERIKNCQGQLRSWNHWVYGNINKALKLK